MLGGDIIAIQQQDMSTMNVQKQRIRTVAVAIRGGLQIPVDLNKKHVQALKVWQRHVSVDSTGAVYAELRQGILTW